jgi:hypothetical protein
MSSSLTPDRIEAAKVLAGKAYSNHQISRELHMSRETVAKVLKNFIRPLCGCGRIINHSGWCDVRAEQSVTRRAYLDRTKVIWGHRRVIRRGLSTSGHGNVAVDAIIIKAPNIHPDTDKQHQEEHHPDEVVDEEEVPSTEKKSAPFTMSFMRGRYPLLNNTTREKYLQRGG